MIRRRQNPFTERQIRFLEAISDKIKEIDDPDKPYIDHESYSFMVKQLKGFGRIPKIVFKPHGTRIKSRIVKKSGIVDKNRGKEIDEIRQKMGFKMPRDKQERILSRLFESELNNIIFKAKKAAFTLALINNLFITDCQQVADPLLLLQGIVMDEYAREIKSNKKIVHREKRQNKDSSKKSYEDELMIE